MVGKAPGAGAPGALAGLAAGLLLALAVLALAMLAGCAGGGRIADGGWRMAEGAYEFYDARVEREIVAGRDGARGNYVEVRLSPRRISEVRDQRPEVGPPASGKEVLR